MSDSADYSLRVVMNSSITLHSLIPCICWGKSAILTLSQVSRRFATSDICWPGAICRTRHSRWQPSPREDPVGHRKSPVASRFARGRADHPDGRRPPIRRRWRCLPILRNKKRGIMLLFIHIFTFIVKCGSVEYFHDSLFFYTHNSEKNFHKTNNFSWNNYALAQIKCQENEYISSAYAANLAIRNWTQ